MRLSFTGGTEDRGALILAMSDEEHDDYFNKADRLTITHENTDEDGDLYFEVKVATNGHGTKASLKNTEGSWAKEDTAVNVHIVRPEFKGERPDYFGRSPVEIMRSKGGVVKIVARKATMVPPRRIIRARAEEEDLGALIAKAMDTLANHVDNVPVSPAHAALFTRLLNRQVEGLEYMVKAEGNRVKVGAVRWVE